MKQKGKTWTDATGRSVDTWAINPVLKVEEKHAQRIADLGLKAEKALKSLNKAVDDAQQEVYQMKLKDAHIKDYSRMPTPNSLTFSTFDKTATVDIITTKRLVFDKTYVNIIKAKFEEFFAVFDKDEIASKRFSFLREMINSLLFKSSGDLDQTSVNEIRAHKATAERTKVPGWELFVEAVELFDKAIRTETGNRLFYVEVAEGGRMRRVALKYTDA
ncbi:hypothetical protein [Williamwhitmania taraxaci]|uniref:Uncharacterized protein n=1 Tax=Williamwhitmania taraxaci TaxID=1640674 RepID=A0A1G6MDB5_9BACT|nr:hypothetical protein [Williamwhitmania taraxaci]SDC53489.1 hypothetical protein SAMN05216323_103545 [Williamwhitmania taraxaci]